MTKKSKYKEIAESFVEKSKKRVPPLNIAIPVSEAASSIELRLIKLANNIRAGRADLAVLKDNGITDPDKLADNILRGNIDMSVFAERHPGLFGAQDPSNISGFSRPVGESILETYHSANIQYAQCDHCGKKEKNKKVDLDPKTKLPKGWGQGFHGRGTDLCKDCFNSQSIDEALIINSKFDCDYYSLSSQDNKGDKWKITAKFKGVGKNYFDTIFALAAKYGWNEGDKVIFKDGTKFRRRFAGWQEYK
jgi:hypothetical protein